MRAVIRVNKPGIAELDQTANDRQRADGHGILNVFVRLRYWLHAVALAVRTVSIAPSTANIMWRRVKSTMRSSSMYIATHATLESSTVDTSRTATVMRRIVSPWVLDKTRVICRNNDVNVTSGVGSQLSSAVGRFLRGK